LKYYKKPICKFHTHTHTHTQAYDNLVLQVVSVDRGTTCVPF